MVALGLVGAGLPRRGLVCPGRRGEGAGRDAEQQRQQQGEQAAPGANPQQGGQNPNGDVYDADYKDVD